MRSHSSLAEAALPHLGLLRDTCDGGVAAEQADSIGKSRRHRAALGLHDDRSRRAAMDVLDMWPHLTAPAEPIQWTQGIVDALSWGVLLALLLLLPLIVLFSRAIRRRRLWCAEKSREVEVVLDERGLPGFRCAIAVQQCT